MKHKKIKIYAGLSLTKEDVAAVIPEAEFRGPIERDDLLKDVDHEFNVIGIVDGKFYQSLAVTPSEILDAIRCGLKVYGSSSIGALRAVEMESFGMIGCGDVFKWIKNTPVFRDDFLGQSFLQDDFSALSVNYADLHFEVKRKVNAKLISVQDADILLEVYAGIYFPQRTVCALKFELKKRFSDQTQKWDDTVDVLFRDFQSQKKMDGFELLNQIKSDLKVIHDKNQMLWALQAGSRYEQDFYR